MTTPRYRIVVDLGFGDGGKGACVDWMCSNQEEPVNLVVKFCGGAQSAHNVVLSNGSHATFRQFGSGTLRGVPTLLVPNMKVNFTQLATECDRMTLFLGAPAYETGPMLYISADCLVTSSSHIKVNRAREWARRSMSLLEEKIHGSCGLGVGATTEFYLKEPKLALTCGDLKDFETTFWKLQKLAQWRAITLADELSGEPWPEYALDLSEDAIEEEARELMSLASCYNIISATDAQAMIDDSRRVVFEGSQGILLDEELGFLPHNTWSDVTPEAAMPYINQEHSPEIWGVCRSYTTRHGAGPFPTEIDASAQTRNTMRALMDAERHNTAGVYNGRWRVGDLDVVLLKYAIDSIGVDKIMMSHMDVLEMSASRACYSYTTNEGNPFLMAQAHKVSHEILAGAVPRDVRPWNLDDIEHYLGHDVTHFAFGPHAEDRFAKDAVTFTKIPTRP